MGNIKNAAILQSPNVERNNLRFQNVCLTLKSSMICHKVHFSVRKSGGPNYLGLSKDWRPLIMAEKSWYRSVFVDTIPKFV